MFRNAESYVWLLAITLGITSSFAGFRSKFFHSAAVALLKTKSTRFTYLDGIDDFLPMI